MLKNKSNIKNIILWNMNYIMASKNPNIGDKVLLDSIIKCLRNSNLNININIFTRDPIIIEKEFNVKSIKYSPFNLYNIIKTLWNSDIFIFAGGEVVIDRGSSLYTPFMMHLACLAKLLKKTIMGYGIGIGKIDEISFIGKLLSRFVFNGAIVSVRDIGSEESLKSISEPKQIICTADPALNLEAAPDEEVELILVKLGIRKNGGPLIAIAPRQPLMPVKKMCEHLYNIIPMKIRELLGLVPPDFNIYLYQFKKRLAEISDYLVQEYNAQLLFIPMFSGFMSYRDDILCHDIIEEMDSRDKVKILDSSYSGPILKRIFGKADLVIGFPLHSIILATSMGVPAIAFSYESKVARYMKAIGLEEYTFNIEDISVDIDVSEVIKNINYVMSNKSTITERLDINIRCMKNNELGNIKMLMKELIENDK